MTVDLTLGAPSSCFSDQICTFSVTGANGFLITAVQIVFRNLRTGASVSLNQSFSTPKNIGTGGSAVFFDVKFNDLISQFPSLIDPGTVCGSGVELQVEAVAEDNATPSGIHTSCNPINAPSSCINTTVVLSPCICTQISDVFTTLDSFACVSIDGKIGIQGKLFEVTCSGGIPSPFVNQPAAVLIGLVDPSTNIFYQYVAAATDVTGTFSVGFAVENNSQVVGLIPDTGSKSFNFIAFYPGSSTHEPSAMFSKPVTVSGKEGPMPCPLGTLEVDTVYNTADPTKETHTLQMGFVGGLVVGGVTLSFANLAAQARDKVHDAIVSAGAVPIEIKVYRGPDIAVPLALLGGFAGIPTASFLVVATAQGSPVAGLVILAAILVVIALLLFFVYLIFAVVKDIIGTPGGASTLIIGGIVLLAGASIAAYLLTRPRVRRALK